MWGRRVVLLCVALGFLEADARAASYSLIVCGQGGTDEYETVFREWGGRLKAVLADSLGHGPVRLLTEDGDGDGPSSLEGIEKAFRDLRDRVTAQDNLWVYLIGHGSYRETARFNVPGPDLTAPALDAMLRSVAAGQTVVVNAASASAGFVNGLSSAGRVICTSTRDVDEWNATRFMEHFIQGLEDGGADRNRDDRISVLEACRQAAELTQAWYTAQGLLATEHAIVDDNGDGLGTRLAREADGEETRGDQTVDGERADTVFLRDWTFPEAASDSLVAAYRAAIDQVQGHIARKASFDASAYYAELELLLVRAARLHRRIRATSP